MSSGWRSGDAELERRGLALLADLFPELGAHLLDDLLDAGRVDAPVHDQLLEGVPRDLAAQRLEGRDDDRLRRVVDDQVDAGGRLERPDVAALAADDAALQVVRRQLDDRHRRLDDRVGGQALDRHADDAAGLLRGLLVGLFLDAADQPGRLEPGLVLDGLDEVPLGVDGRQARDLLEPLALLLDDPRASACGLVDLLLGVGDRLFLAGELLVAALLLGELAVEVLLLLLDPVFEGGDLLPPGLDRLVELDPRREDLFLGLDVGLAQLGVGLLAGVGQGPVGLRPDARGAPARPSCAGTR